MPLTFGDDKGFGMRRRTRRVSLPGASGPWKAVLALIEPQHLKTATPNDGLSAMRRDARAVWLACPGRWRT